MTNNEISLSIAVKALEKGLLSSFEAGFIESIKHYDKKQLRKLTSKQYEMLDLISSKYADEVRIEPVPVTLFEHRITINALPVFEPLVFTELEIRPVFIEGEDANEVSEDKANAFGVYIRYDTERAQVEGIDVNPSYWVADCDTRGAAETLQRFLNVFIKHCINQEN